MREYVLSGAVVAAVCYLLTPYVRRFAEAIGAYTPVRDRDVHTIPTPRLGGLGMFGGICAGMLVASRLPTLQRVFDTSEMRGVLLGGVLLVLGGAAGGRPGKGFSTPGGGGGGFRGGCCSCWPAPPTPGGVWTHGASGPARSSPQASWCCRECSCSPCRSLAPAPCRSARTSPSR